MLSVLTLEQLLDQISERECVKVGVVYIKRGQANQPKEYLQNMGGSEDYQDFISSLGWGVCCEIGNV